MKFELINGLTVLVTDSLQQGLVNSYFDVQLFFNGKLLEESRGYDDFDITGLSDLDSLQVLNLIQNCSNLDKHFVEELVKDEMVWIQVSKGIK